MAKDFRYYKRFNFQSVPMYDYEVRDVMNRADAPDLRINWAFEGSDGDLALEFEENAKFSKQVNLLLTLTNDAIVPAEYTIVNVGIDQRLNILSHGRFRPQNTKSIEIAGQVLAIDELALNMAVPEHMPIWQGTNFSLSDHILAVAFPKAAGSYIFYWRLRSPRMNEKRSFYVLESDGHLVRVKQITDIA